MHKISVVIITYNAARTIDKVLRSIMPLSLDIIVVDSGSTDDTKKICSNYDVKFHEQAWTGYGKQKNIGNRLTKHDWILSIDADEVVSNALIEEISSTPLKESTVYNIPFKNIYCSKEIHFGRWRNERHIRLFNRKQVSWDENPVHETLKIDGLKITNLKNPIYHYSMESKEAHLAKAKKYAEMGAIKLHAQGKKATFIKQYLNPVFRFVKDYFFSLGFLDGKEGLQIAMIISKETFWKYQNLKNLQK